MSQIRSKPGRPRALLPASISLGLTQLRQTWRLLVYIGLAILLMVVLICTVPLFTTVATNVALNDALTDTPTTPLLQARAWAYTASSYQYEGYSEWMSYTFGGAIHQYLAPQPVPYTMLNNFIPLDPTSQGYVPRDDLNATVIVNAASAADLTRILTLKQGRFPRDDAKTPEVVVSQMEVDYFAQHGLQLGIGSTLKLSWTDFFDPKTAPNFTATVVGIVNPSTNPAFTDFNTVSFTPTPSQPNGPRFMTVATTSAALWRFIDDGALFENGVDANSSGAQSAVLSTSRSQELAYVWLYWIDPQTVTYDQIPGLTAALDDLSTHFNRFAQANAVASYGIFQMGLQGDTLGVNGVLAGFAGRQQVPTLPIAVYLVALAGLVLLFVSTMTDLLVSRQGEVLAVLRSRGALRRHVFGSFFFQSVLAILIPVFVLGPPATILAVFGLALLLLPGASLTISATIFRDPLAVVQGMLGSLALIAAAALLAMLISIVRIARVDILALRRESARATRRSIWEALNLDVILALLALGAFVASEYLALSGALSVSLRTTLAPLFVAAPLLLIVALALVFLRLFTRLLEGLSRAAWRIRGAPMALATAIISRTPRHVVRMTLLLAMATAVIIFTLVFSASQAQRDDTIAAYRTQADFSGALLDPNATEIVSSSRQLQEVTARYRAIPGVTSVCAGLVNSIQVSQASGTYLITTEAVDAATFAATMRWSPLYASASAATLANQLLAGRAAASQATITASHPGIFLVPAVVDSAFLRIYNVSVGGTIVYAPLNSAMGNSDPTVQLGLDIVAAVDYIPPIASSPENVNGHYATSGVLVDLPTLTIVKQQIEQYQYARAGGTGQTTINVLPVTPNHVWLRTRDDQAALASVRTAIKHDPTELTNVFDRRLILDSLQLDPFFLNLMGVLRIGAVVIFLLTISGSLLSSWLTVRERMASFAMLRALGADQPTIARIFLWEQGITYGVALVLGVGGGLVMGYTIAQSLVYTGTIAVTQQLSQLNQDEFYAFQHIPPIQTVIPWSLAVIIVAVLAVSVAVIFWMSYLASRPSISQTLRLNVD